MSKMDVLRLLLDGLGGMALLTGVPTPVRVDNERTHPGAHCASTRGRTNASSGSARPEAGTVISARS